MSCEEISLSLRGKGFIRLIGHGHIPDKKNIISCCPRNGIFHVWPNCFAKTFITPICDRQREAILCVSRHEEKDETDGTDGTVNNFKANGTNQTDTMIWYASKSCNHGLSKTCQWNRKQSSGNSENHAFTDVTPTHSSVNFWGLLVAELVEVPRSKFEPSWKITCSKKIKRHPQSAVCLEPQVVGTFNLKLPW